MQLIHVVVRLPGASKISFWEVKLQTYETLREHSLYTKLSLSLLLESPNSDFG